MIQNDIIEILYNEEDLLGSDLYNFLKAPFQIPKSYNSVRSKSHIKIPPVSLRVGNIRNRNMDFLFTKSNKTITSKKIETVNIGNKNNNSGYKNVSFSKSRNKFQCSVTIDGKRKHLGFYDTAEMANEAKLKYLGEK